MNNTKIVAFVMVAAILVVAVAVVVSGQANAMPVSAAASHMGAYGTQGQHAGFDPWTSMHNSFGYMYRMFAGWCRHLL